MPWPEESHLRWIETIEDTGELREGLQEIKKAKPLEIHLFLAKILKRAQHWGNPFHGDTSNLNTDLANVLPELTDIRDPDHDRDNIYHFMLGGLHCFLIEVLTFISKIPPESESVPLLKNYFDYFFNKRRGCTSCAKRVLALLPPTEQIQFLCDRALKRKEAYTQDDPHSPACMELSLWLLMITPIDNAERLEIAKIILKRMPNELKCLIQYSHQRSVRDYLTRFLSE